MSRYRDPQRQVGQNYSYLFYLRSNIYKSFFSNNNNLIRFTKLLLKLTIVVISGVWAKLNNLNFHPLEVVAHYRDPQLQAG